MKAQASFCFLLLAAVPSWAQLCPGDASSNVSFTVNTSSVFRLKIFGRTKLNHASSHPTCSGTVGVNPQLYLDTQNMLCQTGLVWASAPIATDGSGNHEISASRYCTIGFCAEYYRTRSQHYFSGAFLGYTNGNYAPAGDCSGAHCAPCTPGYVPGECGFSEQDPCGCCPDPCPLILDRSGDGVRLSSAANGVLLDINGMGALFWLGWPEGSDDAWLAMDRNGNGAIDNGSELFGNTRNLESGVNAGNGYEVLAELDANGDGKVDEEDPAYARLLLWGDANRNGVSEPTELISLKQAGVRALAVANRETQKRDRWGNRFRFSAVDGSSVDVFPVWEVPDSHEEGKALHPAVEGTAQRKSGKP